MDRLVEFEALGNHWRLELHPRRSHARFLLQVRRRWYLYAETALSRRGEPRSPLIPAELGAVARRAFAEAA